MQSIIFLILILGIVIGLTGLYLKSKTSSLEKLKRGECPRCGETTKRFTKEDGSEVVSPAVIPTLLTKGG